MVLLLPQMRSKQLQFLFVFSSVIYFNFFFFIQPCFSLPLSLSLLKKNDRKASRKKKKRNNNGNNTLKFTNQNRIFFLNQIHSSIRGHGMDLIEGAEQQEVQIYTMTWNEDQKKLSFMLRSNYIRTHRLWAQVYSFPFLKIWCAHCVLCRSF